MRHLLGLQQRNGSSATSHLHRYFDYSGGRQRASQAASGYTQASLGGAPPKPDSVGGANHPTIEATDGYDSLAGIGRFQS
eukprot:scaffold642835_cov34-Prasinocladus_malaysianus.AAC.1